MDAPLEVLIAEMSRPLVAVLIFPGLYAIAPTQSIGG